MKVYLLIFGLYVGEAQSVQLKPWPSGAVPASDAQVVVIGGDHGKSGLNWQALEQSSLKWIRSHREGRQVLVLHETLGDYKYSQKPWHNRLQLSAEEIPFFEVSGLDNHFLSRVSRAFLGQWNRAQIHYAGQIRSYLMAQILLKAHQRFPDKLIVGITGAAHVLDSVISQVFATKNLRADFFYDAANVTEAELQNIKKPQLWKSLMEGLNESRDMDRALFRLAESTFQSSSDAAEALDAMVYLKNCEGCRCFMMSHWDHLAKLFLK